MTVPRQQRRRFEYVNLTFSPDVVSHQHTQDTLNEWGQQGWEIVGALDTNAGLGASREVVVFLKREWQDDE